MPAPAKKKAAKAPAKPDAYTHPEASALIRPEIGTQAHFRKKKPPASYRYDSSLAPARDRDGNNAARERAETQIAALQAHIRALSTIHEQADAATESDRARARRELDAARAAANELAALSRPFLNWAGKAERMSFDVPTLPLFVHERLSTPAILETLKGHAKGSARGRAAGAVDLVFDPTCGAGTTAWCAEKLGRRWITCDTSRVPLALARQRLLTATFDFFSLRKPERGPAGGFVYLRKTNRNGEEIGGIVPHVTLKSIANNVPAKEETLFDRPEKDDNVTRVSGPFCFEATIPAPVDWGGDGEEDSGDADAAAEHAKHVERMIEVLRRAPALRVEGGKTVVLTGVRAPAQVLTLSAEARVEGAGDDEPPVAIVVGPDNGAVSEMLAYEAAREANAKRYGHLYIIGFAIEPGARRLVEVCEAMAGVPATWLQATMDLAMGDLLKTMRASHVFAVCGMPDVRIERAGAGRYRAELLGLDVFDPATMETYHRGGADVPAWFLDTDHDGLSFHVCQAFFPRTSAWDALKRSLRGAFDESVWGHLSGAVSAPFAAGAQARIAVKVIDDRGNELMVVKPLSDAGPAP